MAASPCGRMRVCLGARVARYPHAPPCPHALPPLRRKPADCEPVLTYGRMAASPCGRMRVWLGARIARCPHAPLPARPHITAPQASFYGPRAVWLLAAWPCREGRTLGCRTDGSMACGVQGVPPQLGPSCEGLQPGVIRGPVCGGFCRKRFGLLLLFLLLCGNLDGWQEILRTSVTKRYRACLPCSSEPCPAAAVHGLGLRREGGA